MVRWRMNSYMCVLGCAALIFIVHTLNAMFTGCANPFRSRKVNPIRSPSVYLVPGTGPV